MQLIRPAEMHLPRQRSVVSFATEIVSVGGSVGGQVRGVVVGANLGGQLASHHHKSRRRTQRRVAVRRVESHTFFRETVEVGRFNGGVFVVKGQERRGHLVGHDVENVGLFGGHFGVTSTTNVMDSTERITSITVEREVEL